jgi:hypothetical protein
MKRWPRSRTRRKWGERRALGDGIRATSDEDGVKSCAFAGLHPAGHSADTRDV